MSGHQGNYSTVGIIIRVIVPSGWLQPYISYIKKHVTGAKISTNERILVKGASVEIIMHGLQDKIEKEIFGLTDEFFKEHDIEKVDTLNDIED